MIEEKLTLESCRNYIAQVLFEPKTRYRGEGLLGLVGIEQEAFPVFWDALGQRPIKPLKLHQEEKSLTKLLLGSLDEYEGTCHFFEDDGGKFLEKISFPDGDSIQFEPGGQLEVVTAPCISIIQIQNHLEARQKILGEIENIHSVKFIQIGTNPWFDGTEIGLQLKKTRYLALQRYFNEINPAGQRMMLQTCSQHVNLDLGIEEDTQVKRIILANLLSPILSAIFSNSSILERQTFKEKAIRSQLWKKLDAKRSGIWLPKIQDSLPTKASLIDAYFNFALEAPLLHVLGVNDKVIHGPFNWEYWLSGMVANRQPNWMDFTNHLSLLFPQVRMKGFLEIRSVDALPKSWQMVPATFLTGLLYSKNALEQALEELLPYYGQIDELCTQASLGLENELLYKLCLKISKLSLEGIEQLPETFRTKDQVNLMNSFFEQYTWSRKTVAEDNLQLYIQDKPLII